MSLTVDLSGHRVVVTGASSGIGAETCRRLVGFGAKVAMLARRKERLDELASELGDAVIPLPTDVADLASLQAGISAAAVHLGSFNAVVAVAGQNISGSMMAGDPELWRRVLDVNLVAPLATMRYAGEHLATEGRRDLILVGSSASLLGVAGLGIYGASKRGLRAATESLRLELAPKGINVSLIIPGLFATEGTMTDKIHRDGERLAMDLPVFAPGTSLAPPDGIADTIAYLMSMPQDVCINEMIIRPTGNLYP